MTQEISCYVVCAELGGMRDDNGIMQGGRRHIAVCAVKGCGCKNYDLTIEAIKAQGDNGEWGKVIEEVKILMGEQWGKEIDNGGIL